MLLKDIQYEIAFAYPWSYEFNLSFIKEIE